MEFRPDDVRAILKVLAADREAREEFARVVLPQELVALTARVDALAQHMEALTGRVDALAQQMEALVAQMQAMSTQINRLDDQMGDVRGRLFELDYWFRLGRFQGVAQGPRPLSPDARDDLLRAAIRDGRLTRDEAGEIYSADLVMAARRWADDADVLLVAEVSAIVDASDVERAVRRAELLSRAGTPVLPAVAGARVTAVAAEAAHNSGVWQVTDGKVSPPEPR